MFLNLRVCQGGLRRQGIRPFLVGIQLFIGFICFLIGISMLESTMNHDKIIKKVTDLNTLHLFIEDIGPNSTSEKLLSFYNNLSKNDKIKNIGTFLNLNIPFKELIDSPLIDNKKQSETGVNKVVFLDKNLLEWTKFEVKKGRGLNKNDVGSEPNEIIPTLIGPALEEQFPLGTILSSGIADDRKMTIVDKKFVVVGILKENPVYWGGGSSTLANSILTNQTMFICPLQSEQNYGNQLITRLKTNMLIQSEENTSTEDVKKTIHKNLESNKIYGSISTIKEQLEELKKISRPIILFSLIFSSLILLLSIFGLIGVMLSSVVQRYREFGIRFSLGATITSLINLIIFEILVLALFAFSLALVIFYIAKNLISTPIAIDINIYIIIYSFVLCISISFITSFGPILKLKSIEPAQLIRGGK